jgi:hypothetical protein
MAKDIREGKDRTPEADSADSPETSSLEVTVRSRRNRGILSSFANRLRTAAHFSRARRAEALTEPTIDIVIDDHELYVRQDAKVKRTNTSANNMTTNFSNNNNDKTQPTMGIDRQISQISDSGKVFSNNRYILSHGKIHFWNNYAYGEV